MFHIAHKEVRVPVKRLKIPCRFLLVVPRATHARYLASPSNFGCLARSERMLTGAR